MSFGDRRLYFDPRDIGSLPTNICSGQAEERAGIIQVTATTIAALDQAGFLAVHFGRYVALRLHCPRRGERGPNRTKPSALRQGHRHCRFARPSSI
jgi:hypothetical protein